MCNKEGHRELDSSNTGGGWMDSDQADFELLVMMSSTVEPDKIPWGYEFRPIVYLSSTGKYMAELAYFDKVVKTKTPPLFKQAPPTGPKGNHGAVGGMDPEKMQLEQNYREGANERDSGPASVRISNV